MADAQNLNRASPSALSTGAPPKAQHQLTPAPPQPSNAASAPAPPATHRSKQT